ncbi:MAG: VanZ family protein [Bacteroidota bacterium]
MTGVNLPEQFWDILSWDKLAHAVVYALQCGLILWGGHRNKAATTLDQRVVIAALLISIAYGILMEVIQYGFFPNRFFEVQDIIANIIGSFIGLYVYRRYFLIKT